MRFPRGRLIAVMAAGSLVVVPSVNTHLTRTIGTRGIMDSPGQYSPRQSEFYLSADELGYIRPGFKITLNSITIPDDRKPVVDLSFTDDFNQPLDRLGQVTPGALSINQVLAWWDPDARHYTAYTTRKQTSPITGNTAIQAAADPQKSSSNPNGGVWTDHEVGHSSYKFSTQLPADYDVTKTHTLAIYATRNLTALEFSKNYYDNLEYDFRPDGHDVTETWDKTTNAACNRCHDLLSAHGGSRQDVKLCVTCHQPQTVDPDTGNTVDMKVMVHKIHRGEFLPSVEAGTPYIIIGNQQSVHDYSTVVFPQDIRNCVRCHTPEASQSNVWYTFPSRAACGSCHDDIDWVTGANHPAGAQADDSACASCHIPQGDREYDASIQGAHTVPYRSTQLKGLNSTITEVINARPGQMPTVVFQITEDDGTPVAPSSFTTSTGSSNLNLLMGGPTTDYAINPVRQRADHAEFDGTTATYTFTTPIPADATGTWAFSVEARRDVNFTYPPPEGNPVREGALNHVHYADLSGGTPQPRRTVVDLALCNTCHDRLVLHGGQRFNTEECVMCHNPNASDAARRPADQAPVESIDFKRMIHRIHTGEELSQDFTIYGFGNNPINFNEVRFPGDRRDCATCHVDDSQQVQATLPPGRLPTETLRDWYTPQQPTAAACLGCHDSQSAAAHAFVNTAPFGEACAACHGENADFSVDRVHAH